MGYDKVAAPFLAKYCGKCHAGGKLEGEFSVEASKLVNNFIDPAAKARWNEVVNVLNSHEMPPEERAAAQARGDGRVCRLITAQAVRAELSNRERGVVLRRLNRVEYRNTIRDLLSLDFDVSGFRKILPPGFRQQRRSAVPLPVAYRDVCGRRAADPRPGARRRRPARKHQVAVRPQGRPRRSVRLRIDAKTTRW